MVHRYYLAQSPGKEICRYRGKLSSPIVNIDHKADTNVLKQHLAS